MLHVKFKKNELFHSLIEIKYQFYHVPAIIYTKANIPEIVVSYNRMMLKL